MNYRTQYANSLYVSNYSLHYRVKNSKITELKIACNINSYFKKKIKTIMFCGKMNWDIENDKMKFLVD